MKNKKLFFFSIINIILLFFLMYMFLNIVVTLDPIEKYLYKKTNNYIYLKPNEKMYFYDKKIIKINIKTNFTKYLYKYVDNFEIKDNPTFKIIKNKNNIKVKIENFYNHTSAKYTKTYLLKRNNEYTLNLLSDNYTDKPLNVENISNQNIDVDLNYDFKSGDVLYVYLMPHIVFEHKF